MSRWFRVYADLIDDPKFIKLGPDLRNALLMMWCVAAGNDGRLPEIQDIAIKFRLSLARTTKLLDELHHCGFIDDDGAGLAPHNWNARQFKSDITDPTAAERQKKYRNAKRNATVTPTVTVTDTRDRTEQSRAETEKIAPDGASANGKTYAFEDGVIRLTPKDFSKWEQSFERLDLRAELLSLSKWAGEQEPGNWFHAVKGALAKRNRDVKTAAQNAARGGHLPLTPAGNPWPEGIT